MADPITDTILVGYTAEELLAGAGAAINAIEDFLGYEGMQAAYDIIHGLGELDLTSILPELSFDEGVVTLANNQVFLSNIKNLGDVMAAFNTISKILFNKGVDLATAAGRELFEEIITKIKYYGPGLTAAALGPFVANEAIKLTRENKEIVNNKQNIMP